MVKTVIRPTKVIVKCKHCGWRIFDKVTPTTGVIEIKCQKCGTVSAVDLSLRKAIKYRTSLAKVI